jgi:hypothetical protein
MKEKKDRFDLEQEIMGVWHIIDDLRTLMDKWDELTEDKKLNILIGISDLYDIKLDTLFSTFESCIAKKQLEPYRHVYSYEESLNREYAEDFARKHGAQC